MSIVISIELFFYLSDTAYFSARACGRMNGGRLGGGVRKYGE